MNESYYNDGISYLSDFDGFGDQYEIVAVEDEFYEGIEDDFQFHGIIDLLLRDKTDNKLIIKDHKSKGSFKSKRELHEYARQLYLYSVHVFRKYGEYPKYLQFNNFRKQAEKTIQFNQQDYEEALSWMRDTVKQIRECKDYPAIITEVEDKKKKKYEFFCRYLCDHGKTCEFGRCTEDDNREG